MKELRISITKWQHEMLLPLFSVAKKAFEAGNPVSILAQVIEDIGIETDGGHLEVRVVDGKTSKKIQAALGVESGLLRKKGRVVTVLAPEE